MNDPRSPEPSTGPGSEPGANPTVPPNAPTVDFDATALSGAAAAVPGGVPAAVGRYKIERLLGRGGMGSVYLAHDPLLDRRVALKVPAFVGGPTPGTVERFLREARAAATLTHANICPVYDVGVADGSPYLAMAYVEGKPLSEFIRGGQQLPERAVAAVVRQLALAMQEAHARGVVHRGLKRANVMITPRRRPVIMDFGLACRSSGPADEIQPNQEWQLLVTPPYMPPEQINGDLEAMVPACDVYSLVIILYELLAGRPPFLGRLGDLLAAIIKDAPPPPSQFRPGL